MVRNLLKELKKVEENNFGVRKRLLEYDDIMNAQGSSTKEDVLPLTLKGCNWIQYGL